MEKVSIIVPIYNEEENIVRCVNSLISQTYNNLEIILINDGSTDNTKEVLKGFDDKRIIVVNKENTGIGDTRNLGIEKSTGDYIMFIDSDDYIEHNCVESMLKFAKKNKCDLVVSNYYLDTPTKTTEMVFPDFGVTSLKEDINLLTKINLGPCNKIYNKKLFKNTDNRFPVDLKFEDAPVVVQAICDSKKVGLNKEFLFHYVIKKTGETITRDKRMLDIIKICNIIEKKLEKHFYVDKTNFFVKMLTPYLKSSRFFKDKKIQREFIDNIYKFLDKINKKWYNCSYLKSENKIKKIIIKHKTLLLLVNKF